jgi:hypothetical protein
MSVFGNIMSRIFRGSTLGPKPAEARPASEQGGQAAEPAHEARSAPVQAPPSMPGTGAAPPPGGGMSSPAMATPGTMAAPASMAAPAAMPVPAAVDVEAVLVAMESRATQPLNWRSSIVDLMKLLEIDSSLGARKELARELGYGGALDGSAEMNTWLHRAVMRQLAENGGRVPDSLRD